MRGPQAAGPGPERARRGVRGGRRGGRSVGDHARAAAAYERAYRLTLAAETGPRLLFLRASVAARLRADDGTPATREQLCRAQALLRGYLGEVGRPGDRRAREPRAHRPAHRPRARARLRGAARRRGGAASRGVARRCDGGAGADAPDPVGDARATGDAATPAQMGRRTPGQRALLVGGILGLGVGVAGVAVMGSGVAISRRANERGREACVLGETGCSAIDLSLMDIIADGRRGDRLTRIGAVIGGLGLIVGVALVVAGELQRRRPRVAVSPRLGPGELGVGLTGRF
jgi:hypothetical protein